MCLVSAPFFSRQTPARLGITAFRLRWIAPIAAAIGAIHLNMKAVIPSLAGVCREKNGAETRHIAIHAAARDRAGSLGAREIEVCPVEREHVGAANPGVGGVNRDRPKQVPDAKTKLVRLRWAKIVGYQLDLGSGSGWIEGTQRIERRPAVQVAVIPVDSSRSCIARHPKLNGDLRLLLRILLL